MQRPFPRHSLGTSLKMVVAVVVTAWVVPCSTKADRAIASPLGWTHTDLIASQSQTDKGQLVLGQAVNSELKRGESHTYSITLKAGQYMRVVIDQQNRTNLSVHALDPAGKVIAEISMAGESLWALAETTGDYQIKISAPTIKGSYGPYKIYLEEIGDLKTASLTDQVKVKAHGLVFEGDQAVTSRDTRSVRRAIDCFQQALPLWRQLGNLSEEAYTLHELGFSYAALGEVPKALEIYAQAILIWETTKDHKPDAATTLYNMGTLYSFSGKTAEAIKCFQKAIELERIIGDKGTLAYALTNLGQVYINIGEFQAALKCHEEALQFRRDVEDVAGEARSLSNVAGVFFRLGEFQHALTYSLEALPLRRKAGDRHGEAITLANLGATYRELGEPKEALGYYQQALSILPQEKSRSDNRYVEGSIIDGLGRSFYELGDYEKALQNYNQSLALRQTPKEPYGESATLTNIGNVYARMGNREKALGYYDQALTLQRSIGDRRGQALTLQRAGELYSESGDLKRARDYFNEGLALSQAIKNRSCEAALLYDIARAEQKGGHPIEARAHVEAAISIIESARAVITSTDLRASFLASKQDSYELDIDLLMQSYLRDKQQDSLIQAFNVSERARARSLLDSLGEARANIREGIPPVLLARERALRARLNESAETQIKLLSADHTSEQAAAQSKIVEAVTRDYEQLLAEIRTSSERYAALTQPAPVDLREIQNNLLDPDTLLLEYALGQQRSYVWVVTRDSISGFELPARAEIESLARRAYDLMTSRNHFVKFETGRERQIRITKTDSEYQQVADQLSRVLLGPLTAELRKPRLLIVSDGTLQYVPFAALPLPESLSTSSAQPNYIPLIAKYEITNLQSASTLVVLRNEIAGRQPAPKTIAVLADPVFDVSDDRVRRNDQRAKLDEHVSRKTEQKPEAIEQDQLTRSVNDIAATGERPLLPLPRLRFTRDEARAIVALTSADERKEATDFAANRATAVDPQLSQYRYVHFATHGLLNNRHPELSGIVLSLVDENGKERDGFLLANEIYNLNLPAELVVLSGCRTGLGKEIKGEGILSLTRSFMYAGAARVAVSLWDVNDKSTAELMMRFYQQALGANHLSPSAALRHAQVAMSKSTRWHAPYYWAAFVIQGEYR